MLSIDPQAITTPELHGYLLGAVAPRPICFASTVDADGNVNLAPYSFFNVFSANPPVMIFSPARRVRGNTTKHTLENVLETREVVINIVSHSMVQQMSLSSTEYDKGVNEFVKAGFTEIPSERITPPRVLEAPVQFECKVNDVIALGEEGGAGNLVIAEVVQLHVNEDILDADGKIDPLKIDTVSRLGGNWYSRAKDGLFEVEKPLRTLGIGVDALPEGIRLSTVLTGNDLGMLGNIESLPNENEIVDMITTVRNTSVEQVHQRAQGLLSYGKTRDALCLLLAKDSLK
ncbi:MAG: flavin reductase family protein [Bacteroidetes bacterium]|nr:flavin reductase family protein [Bacteroidota bacterium]